MPDLRAILNHQSLQEPVTQRAALVAAGALGWQLLIALLSRAKAGRRKVSRHRSGEVALLMRAPALDPIARFLDAPAPTAHVLGFVTPKSDMPVPAFFRARMRYSAQPLQSHQIRRSRRR
jgi:hypothetical protein